MHQLETAKALQSTIGAYINYAVQKEKKACSITVLPRCRHQVHIVVLYKQVGYTIIQHHWILRLWITLKHTQEVIREKLKFPGSATHISIHNKLYTKGSFGNSIQVDRSHIS
jgi:hypothetical protein